MNATAAPPAGEETPAGARGEGVVRRFWPLAALMLLAAALRLSTLDLQSFWYDEAFTPVHVLHPSLWATLRSMVHTENSPPLWYVIAWADARMFGTSEIALRWPSALAGLATVPLAWGIGRELTGRRVTAIATAGLIAVNPLFVWYSQEARTYALFVLLAALTMFCFLRALRVPSGARMTAFALSGALALLSHYFMVFLLLPMVVWLGWERARRRSALPASAALAFVSLALLPLIFAQGGHGTQWIGRWALASRLQAIPQYYLTGYSGAPLGHGIELLIALPILLGFAYGLWRTLEPSEQRGALLMATVAAGGILLPIALIAFGADYLGPRNLLGAMIPVSALIAIVIACRRAGTLGVALVATLALAFLAISLDVDLSARLQRGNWRAMARQLRAPANGASTETQTFARVGGAARSTPARAITTVQLGTAPLEYYLPGLRGIAPGKAVRVSEIDQTGYPPLRASAGEPPAPGFQLYAHSNVDGLIVYRFLSPVPRTVSEVTLRRHAITLEHAEVLVSAGLSGTGGRNSR